MKAKRILILLLVAIILYVTTPTAYAAAYLEMEAGGWHYRYYYSGVIDLCYHLSGSAENVVVPAKIGAVPVRGFCEGNEYYYTVMLADEKIKSITFELQVTHLPESFAANCVNLESVTLPESLTSIPEKAFYNCVKLSSINIPKGLKSIDAGAFMYCKALQSVTLPSSLQTIDLSAFNSCSALKTVTLPSSLRRLGDSVFAYCTALESVVINDGLQQIDSRAFSLCTSLGSIVLPETVTSVGAEAFRNCKGLKSAVLPEGLTVISTGLFKDCVGLESVTIPSTVYSIQGEAFSGCHKLDGITLPSKLRLLQDGAFAGCRSLSAITIPGSVSNIAARAFYGCTGLKNVTVQHGVRSIGEHEDGYEGESTLGHTFANCSADLSVTLPISVISVCKNCFDGVTQKYIDGEKRYLDRIEFASTDDRNGFKYRVPVSFSTVHGDTPATIYPYVGEAAALPAPEATGYSFDGWQLGEETFHDTYTVGDSGVTLTAKWSPNVNTITFYYNNDTATVPVTVVSGFCVSEPQNQVVGDEFITGWYKQDDPLHLYDFSQPVLESFTLYASWSSAPLIEVNITGILNKENKVEFSNPRAWGKCIYAVFDRPGSAHIPADAVMFIYTESDNIAYSGSITAEIPFGDDGTYYTRITDIVNGVPDYMPEYGSHTTVDIQFYSAPKVIANIQIDDKDSLSEDVIKGLWELTDGRCPPTKLNAGDIVTVSSDSMMSAEDILNLTLYPPEGYACDGSIINGEQIITVSAGKLTYEGIVPRGSITLNLHFYSKANYVTLTFNSVMNSSFITLKYPRIESGHTVFTVPDCPFTYSVYTFNHWQMGDDAQSVLNPGDIVTLPDTDTEYNAVWDKAYALRFRVNVQSYEPYEGKMETMSAYESDDYTTTVPECGYSRPNFAFTGWNTRSNGKGISFQPGDSITLTASTSLYAQWEEAFIVNLFPNDESDGDPVRQKIPLGFGAALLSPFVREGFLFTGWNNKDDGNGSVSYAPGETIYPTENMTLYAQWQEYQFDSFVWAEDCKTAQVKLVCAGDASHATYVDAEMHAYEKAATCTADADTVYEAVYGEHTDSRTVTQENSALGHSYGAPEWTWTEILTETEDPAGSGLSYNPRRYSATAAFSCERGDDTRTLTAEVTNEVTSEPTAAEPGERTYTASVTFNGTAYTNTKTETIPALGLSPDQAAVALINAIGEVVYTDDCHNTIVLARAVYDSLTDNEKALVTNYETLTSAEEQYAFLESLRPKVTNHMLVLSGEIGVMFRVHFPANFDPTNCRMDFAVEDGRTSSMSYADAKTIEGSDDRYFTCYINALELADNITATLTFGDGETRTDSFSAMAYIEYVQENMTDNTKLLDLVNALQDYGYYLQNSTWTDGTDHTRITAPVNALTSERMETARQDVILYGFISNLQGSGIEAVLLSLTLNAETRINFFVKPRDGVTITTPGSIQTTIDGETYYQFQSPKLGAGALGNLYYFTIETNEGKDAIVLASAMSYVRIALNSYGYHTEFANNDKNAMAAFYYYYKCAVAYQSTY